MTGNIHKTEEMYLLIHFPGRRISQTYTSASKPDESSVLSPRKAIARAAEFILKCMFHCLVRVESRCRLPLGPRKPAVSPFGEIVMLSRLLTSWPSGPIQYVCIRKRIFYFYRDILMYTARQMNNRQHEILFRNLQKQYGTWYLCNCSWRGIIGIEVRQPPANEHFWRATHKWGCPYDKIQLDSFREKGGKRKEYNVRLEKKTWWYW